MDIKQLCKNLLKKKSADELIATSKKSELKKTLNVFDLIVIGIGAVVGTGIFTIIGTAIQGGPESVGAGPAIVISMFMAAIACVFSALCYSEIAAMIPVAGSAYTYTYATMGEFMAWMVGWILMLEYAIGNITVACAWTGYLAQLLKGFKAYLPSFIINFPLWLRSDYRSISVLCQKYGWDMHDKIPYLFDKIPICLNLPAIFIVIVLTMLLVKGIKESTRFASIMVGVNMLMIISFIAVGAFYVKPENWVPFAPNGFEGVFMGAFLIFFAYIGFDAISTTAEETENPQRDLPIAIIGTLVICTVLYVCVALVLTGIVPLGHIDAQAPIAHAMRVINKDWFAGFISVGALCALTSVILIYQLGTTRILYAMSRDRFLPRSLRLIHRKYRTPYVLTWVSGIIVILCSLFMDLNISAELCNFGTFTSFIIICIAVLMLRKSDPDRERPFKVPFCPWFPILGIITCGGLMIYSMKFLKTSSIYFPLWLLIGIFIYATYGYQQKRLEDQGITHRTEIQRKSAEKTAKK
ncbi:MAG: amino acid permease [Clostridiaceae bacterium]|jgi:basic amino acid/polyamine antiporter, APA family|nr:amino acid permease [Clostridiaceae bacterium]